MNQFPTGRVVFEGSVALYKLVDMAERSINWTTLGFWCVIFMDGIMEPSGKLITRRLYEVCCFNTRLGCIRRRVSHRSRAPKSPHNRRDKESRYPPVWNVVVLGSTRE